jgi:hypothetical protein
VFEVKIEEFDIEWLVPESERNAGRVSLLNTDTPQAGFYY